MDHQNVAKEPPKEGQKLYDQRHFNRQDTIRENRNETYRTKDWPWDRHGRNPRILYLPMNSVFRGSNGRWSNVSWILFQPRSPYWRTILHRPAGPGDESLGYLHGIHRGGSCSTPCLDESGKKVRMREPTSVDAAVADYDGTGRVDEEEEAEAAEATEEEEGGAAGCAVLCRDGVVGLMVAGSLRPLRLRPPSPAPRYQPPIPLVVPQGSTVLPPTKPPLVLALSESPTNPRCRWQWFPP